MWVIAIAIAFIGLVIAAAIAFAGAIAAGAIAPLEGILHLFYAIHNMQMRMDLDAMGEPIPDWLKIGDDEDENPDAPDAGVIKLSDRRKDK